MGSLTPETSDLEHAANMYAQCLEDYYEARARWEDLKHSGLRIPAGVAYATNRMRFTHAMLETATLNLRLAASCHPAIDHK